MRLVDSRTAKHFEVLRHEARRGDGGIPLSPLSLLTAVGTSLTLKADTDVMPSLVDDALRRMCETLPRLRST